MNSQIVYKVVRAIDGRYYSAIVTDKDWRVEYKPGKFVRAPEGSELLAFWLCDYAITFARKMEGPLFEVWKCQARGCQLIESLCPSARPSRFKDFWRERRYRNKSHEQPVEWYQQLSMFFRAPPGTVGCSMLKLLERVES